MPNSHPILFFDGVCNLCNKWVDYTIRHDAKGVFRFASLQSEYAKTKLLELNIDPTDLNTVILLADNKVYTKSRVAGQSFIRLGGWKAIIGKIILFVPAPIADIVYDLIARNRYLICGKRDTCRVPTAEERERFMD